MFNVGDTVYYNKRGWSGVPMEILFLRSIDTQNGMVKQALCKGVDGFSVAGLYSKAYQAQVSWYALSTLAHQPNLAMYRK